MNIKFRLTLLSFLQFFVWGAWLITIANYWFGTKQWDGTKFGAVFSTMGIASVFMPTLVGIIADRWINAEKFMEFCIFYTLHSVLFTSSNYTRYIFCSDAFAMVFYMPTIALANSISYTLLKNNNYDVVKDFPPIRVWEQLASS